ncbi:MAG: hypothetical protein FWE04_06830 [Oscillospiraceae bacterium]|nr:hypothetical protein [Oscillospiraceae bacterium]
MFIIQAIAILGAIAVLWGTIQYLFCVKAKKMSIKLIPVYLIALLILFVTVLWVFGTDGFGTRFLAFFLALGIGAAILGDVIAWIAYFPTQKNQDKDS